MVQRRGVHQFTFSAEPVQRPFIIYLLLPLLREIQPPSLEHFFSSAYLRLLRFPP